MQELGTSGLLFVPLMLKSDFDIQLISTSAFLLYVIKLFFEWKDG